MKSTNAIKSIKYLAGVFLFFSNYLYSQDTIIWSRSDFYKNLPMYNPIKIGNQIWSSSNAKIETFNNGDEIPQASSYAEWEKAGAEHKPAWCYQYLNELSKSSSNVDTCGKLYNWYAINDKRGFAPNGWHVPSKAEFDTLIKTLGGEKMAGKKLRVDLDSTGFRAFAVGYRFANGDNDHKKGFSKITPEERMENNNENYYEFDVATSFWSLSPISNYDAYSLHLSFINSAVYFQELDKGNGRSVRLIKN